MCGITGFLDFSASLPEDELNHRILRMTDPIRHRGPDDEGHWVSPEHGIALGFRRLAIIDISPTGHQPMISASGRYVIIFNGEIYNFGELRQELLSLGERFRGTSDTEIILAAVSRWGLQATIRRLNGMFAFALWDREDKTLSLVRDRLGVKPMYYGWAGQCLLFGSELKALRAHPDFEEEIDRNALTLFFRHGYIPAPHTIYQRFRKLPPGCLLTIPANQRPGDPVPERYWSARQVQERGLSSPFAGSEEDAIQALEEKLLRSVRLRMIADVPLGAFLSGGVDSSTIVALMQAQNRLPVKTFTIGFREKGYDEAEHARAVARHLGTDHTELYVTPEEAQAVIPRLPALYDEPFADSSQIPTFLVSELARRHVTVSLSGDGGDELFGGYDRYLLTLRIWQTMSRVPAPLRGPAAAFLDMLAAVGADESGGNSRVRDRIRRIGEYLAAKNPSSIYVDMLSHWKEPERLVVGGREPLTEVTDPTKWLNSPRLTDQMMALDLVAYLPDDILTKVDRASMGVSLEARVPFLDDHEVVEFAWSLPLEMKIRQNRGKWILRQVLYKYVPQELIERPKMGFGVPIGSWMRGPLREWAEGLLDESRLRREGFLNPGPIRQKWDQHLSGRTNWQYYLWDILMFQAWLAESRPARI